MALGERLGVGDVEGGTGDGVPRSRASTSASVSTCPPRDTFTSQARSCMASSSGAPMTCRVSGVSARARITRRASGSASGSASMVRVRAAPGTGSGRRRTTVTGASNGARSRTSDVAMPPPPTMVTGCPARAVTLVPCHVEARAEVGQRVQSGQGQGQGVLGDERGVRALAAGEDATVGHEPGVDEALDPGTGEVHPADGGELLEDRAEPARAPTSPPTRAPRRRPPSTTSTAAAHHGLGRQGPVGDDGDARLGATHGLGA